MQKRRVCKEAKPKIPKWAVGQVHEKARTARATKPDLLSSDRTTRAKRLLGRFQFFPFSALQYTIFLPCVLRCPTDASIDTALNALLLNSPSRQKHSIVTTLMHNRLLHRRLYRLASYRRILTPASSKRSRSKLKVNCFKQARRVQTRSRVEARPLPDKLILGNYQANPDRKPDHSALVPTTLPSHQMLTRSRLAPSSSTLPSRTCGLCHQS